MKKIINGKKYDTDTAREIGSDSGGEGFSFWRETLYIKRTGVFFLHGIGGPMTKYAESAGQNSWSGGAQIVPMSEDEAKAWAEKHLTADEYEAAFGPCEE